MKRYSEAINDLNAAIEADPMLSEAYFRRASILRQLCRFFQCCNFCYFLYLKEFSFSSAIQTQQMVLMTVLESANHSQVVRVIMIMLMHNWKYSRCDW